MVSRAIRRLGNQVHDDVKVTSSAITIHWVLAAHCGFGYLPSGAERGAIMPHTHHAMEDGIHPGTTKAEPYACACMCASESRPLMGGTCGANAFGSTFLRVARLSDSEPHGRLESTRSYWGAHLGGFARRRGLRTRVFHLVTCAYNCRRSKELC
jgi:hypothetical protein